MGRNMHTEEGIVLQLQDLGVEAGDVLLIRASLGKLGRVKGGKNSIYGALKSSVGDNGTLVTLGFTKIFPFWKVDRGYLFDENTPSTTGALSKLFLSDSQSRRSSHPCCSFISVGDKSEFIVEGHTANSLSYTPIEKLISLNAKMLLIGCADSSPGFTTVHYAQELLGITKKNYFSGLFRVFYKCPDTGETKLFIRKDIGGCSKGFENMYKDYIKRNALFSGMVGDAYCLLIDTKTAFEIDLEKLKENKKYVLCSSPVCVSCRASWVFNMIDIPVYIFHKIYNKFKR